MPPNAVENNFCFVLYPPGKRFINLWDAVLEPAIISSGMKALRSADIGERYDNLMEGIRKHILNARLIVAVLDEQSLSVVYELGLAHAAKKHVIILLEEGKVVPEVFSYLSLLRYDPEDFPSVRKELGQRIRTASGVPEEDLFPELPIRSPAEWEEYQYLKLTRKKLTIKVTPKNCSIFFNNRLLGASPQIIRVNPDAKRNVVSVTAIGQFDYYKILTAEDINNQELVINLEQRDASKYPAWVNKWLKLRREDPDSSGVRVSHPHAEKQQWQANSNSLLAEQPLLLNPELDDRLEEHFDFLPDGKLKPLTLRAETTVTLCDLNRDRLVLYRRGLLDRAIDDLVDCLDVYREVEKQGIWTTLAQVEKAKRLAFAPLIKKLQEAGQAHRTYSAFSNCLFANFKVFVREKISQRRDEEAAAIVWEAYQRYAVTPSP